MFKIEVHFDEKNCTNWEALKAAWEAVMNVIGEHATAGIYEFEDGRGWQWRDSVGEGGG